MTKFEQIGCQLQQSSDSIREACRRFNYSCQICCTRGVHIDCDHCAIQCVHQQTVACLRDFKPNPARLCYSCRGF